jgi:hypothetical protein
MKSKNLLRIVALLAMLFSVLGTGLQAQAMENSENHLGAQIVIRSTTFWDAVFVGTANSEIYERWSLQLEDPSNFEVTVTTATGDLIPSIYFLDSNTNQIVSVVGDSSEVVLTTNQPAGDYFIQVQPVSGGGTYTMSIQKLDDPVVDPNAVIALDPASVDVDGTSTATVFLNNLPEGGYASAEFTCTYDPAFVDVGNFADSGLFGLDSAVVINEPEDGSFIFALAGSNGQRATASGEVFTFPVTGLQVGQTVVACQVRVSTGNALTDLGFSQVTLTITESGNEELPGTLTGTVLASKPTTVTLYDDEASVVGTALTDEDGNFSLTAPAGSYTVIATSIGHLKAQGTPTLTIGETTTMQTVSLPAGDIDGNDVIDQFDAMTIGFNYGLSAPAEADLNNDGVINVLDLELLAANYRQSGALNWQ